MPTASRSSGNVRIPAALDAVSAWIRGRRSVKPADMDPVREIPEDVLVALLENATWAPSHGLTEPWHFRIHRGAAREALAVRLQDLYRRLTPQEEFRDDKLSKLGRNPLLAPVVILVCMRRQPSGKIPEIEEVEAVACAVQNLHLSASAAGLAGYWSSPPILYHSEAPPAFGLNERDRCLGLFYLGWPKTGIAIPVSARRPLDEKCEWIDA